MAAQSGEQAPPKWGASVVAGAAERAHDAVVNGGAA